MTPVIPCSVSSISLVPGTAVTTRRNRCFARYNYHRKPTIQPLNSLRFFLTLPRTVRTCLQYRTECIKHHRSSVSKLLATGTDVAVEEQDLPAADEDSTGPREEPSAPVETTEDASPKPSASAGPSHSKQRQGRKSEMPPVKDEDLVPGATFTGKVRSILPFGAFVDFGAFTDGLVHVSQLSDNFVRDVGNVVSVGQEVKVKLVEVNTETGRISLSMRDLDGNSKLQQKKDDISSSEKSRPPRKNSSKPSQWKGEVKKSSKFVRGQDLMGTVKNITRSGAFINLPEGKEGFLPSSEEPDEGFGNVMGGSSLEIGQEVSIRVLRVTRGQVTLTMKREEDVQKLDSQLNQGVLYEATNPFVLAFRRNKDIAAFLDEREKLQETSESSEKLKAQEVEATTKQAETVSDILTEETLPAISDDSTVTISDAVNDAMDNEDGSQPRIEDAEINATEISSSDDNDQSTGPDASENLDGVVKTEGGETEAKSELLAPEAEASTEAQTMEEPSTTVGPEGDGKKLEISGITTEQISSSEAVASEQIVANDATAEDEVKITNPVVFNPDDNNVVDGEEVAVTAQAEAAVAGDEVQTPISTTDENIDVPPAEDGDTPTDLTPASGELSEGQIDDFSLKDEEPVQQVAVEDQSYSPAPVENENGISTPEKDESLGDSNLPISSTSTEESAPKAAISPALVKQLREETGAGMMDCKKALSETGGDIVKAQEYLRKKGLASADKKASRVTAEGRIGSYIHDSRIGVLIEVNCETDFVSWGEIFKALVDDLAMQVAACPQVEYLSTDDVPKEIVEKETEIEMQKEDLLSKPEQIRSKIVEGRVKKRLGDLALLEQAYIKDDKVVVKDWVKQTIATIGENIKVKRFVRYNLGEGLEKKNQDFAAEVAAQTAIKSEPVPSKEQPAEAETDKPVEKTPAVAVSAALVKQLREETGAGMMDCKKALSETGGDLKKAQEYLRKKGLLTADKKSSRLAAEGRIGSYIHDSRIGVLIEVNCETDFVGRSEKFKELVDDLAMQAVACPQVEFVSIEDIPESVVSKEKEIEMQREDILSKPENIREKIVAGRVSKRLGELTLLEQPFIKDDTILVKDLVKQTVAALGENIKVRRFIRFTLGEQTENVESKTEA